MLVVEFITRSIWTAVKWLAPIGVICAIVYFAYYITDDPIKFALVAIALLSGFAGIVATIREMK